MSSITIDLITENPETGEFALILIEDGPWPEDSANWEECLTKIQSRIFDAIDTAVDGHLAKKHPESFGKKVRVQIDSPNGLPPALAKLVAKVRAYIEEENAYHAAIQQSRFIQGLRICTGHEMGNFKN